MDERLFRKILRQYIKGKATDEEKKLIDRWYDTMSKGDSSLSRDSDKRALKQRDWSVISGHIKNNQVKNQPIGVNQLHAKSIVWYSLGVAASLAFLIVCYSIFITREQPEIKPMVEKLQATVTWTTVENTSTVRKQFNLPDQSTITLEPNSQLKYESLFNQTKREVFLEGEAHFKVAHDVHRPFLVHAREVTTSVLGTSFTVKAFDNDKQIRVAVQTGKVAVSANPSVTDKNPARPEVILTPNQQIVYNRSERTMLRSLVEEPRPIPAEEKTRRMRFEEAPVSEIFAALEQVYGVEIRFDKNRFSSCVLTTSISDGGIYNRLDIICQAIGAQYAIEEGQIVITGTGCE